MGVDLTEKKVFNPREIAWRCASAEAIFDRAPLPICFMRLYIFLTNVDLQFVTRASERLMVFYEEHFISCQKYTRMGWHSLPRCWKWIFYIFWILVIAGVEPRPYEWQYAMLTTRLRWLPSFGLFSTLSEYIEDLRQLYRPLQHQPCRPKFWWSEIHSQ